MERTQTILIVEDDEPVRRLIARFLTRSGYRAIEAANGRAALKALADLREQGEAPDLIITDVNMPDMNGREFIQRAAHTYGARPTLYISGVGPRERVNPVTAQPIFLGKPFPMDVLLDRVQRLLPRRERDATSDSGAAAADDPPEP